MALAVDGPLLVVATARARASNPTIDARRRVEHLASGGRHGARTRRRAGARCRNRASWRTDGRDCAAPPTSRRSEGARTSATLRRGRSRAGCFEGHGAGPGHQPRIPSFPSFGASLGGVSATATRRVLAARSKTFEHVPLGLRRTAGGRDGDRRPLRRRCTPRAPDRRVRRNDRAASAGSALPPRCSASTSNDVLHAEPLRRSGASTEGCRRRRAATRRTD